MDTPICDFVRRYQEICAIRMHMPGHKGTSLLGMEQWDITEIAGADSLYEASGIIAQSEKNAGHLFGCHTFYSTEGSSLSIRSMLYLAQLYAKETGKKQLIAAGRNAHKAFLSGAALLDMDIAWLYPAKDSGYLSCSIDADSLRCQLEKMDEAPVAVYLTSPDYLGNTVDIGGISKVCREKGILLLVDNAHGAYRKFLEPSCHPMDLGADMCADSAHKTLPVLTGGAYLHISDNAPAQLCKHAKAALSLFGSTSPSYLILMSLDKANQYLSEGYRQKLWECSKLIDQFKEDLKSYGYVLTGDEPLKVTIMPKVFGYLGTELSDILAEHNIFCEFADPDHLVLMLTPENDHHQLNEAKNILKYVKRKEEILQKAPAFIRKERVLSLRQAMLAESVCVPVQESCGRILASASVSCPPAVPVLMCGERIDENAVECFKYYGIEYCTVIK